MAFNQLVQGSVTATFGEPINISTTIMETCLAQTDELAFLQNGTSMQYMEAARNLETAVNEVDGWAYPGLASTAPTGARGRLRSALEDVFQNFTLSLLAERTSSKTSEDRSLAEGNPC